MKISVEWLRQYLGVDIPVPRLVETLNRLGLMVEKQEEADGDTILEVETYSNRPDTLGHLGMARELAAALGLRLKEIAWPLSDLPLRTAELVDVQIVDANLCPRYCGLVVKGIKVGPSPAWLKKRIEAMGLNPINNIVDVTNFVLFATAQPIHAFDLKKIGAKIIVRRAKKGERLLCLDGLDRALTQDMLVIADETRPVALAGVIGGQESAVSEDTQDIFIESACFDPVTVRLSRKAAELQTDASYRFERGSDISFPPQAALMAASLMTQFGGRAAREIADVYPQPRKKKEIIVRHRRITEMLGVEVKEEFVEQTLAALEFQVESQQAGIWRVKIPSFRVDIDREADLVEEIARFFGYENIPAVLPPLRVTEPVIDRNRERIEKIRPVLFHCGFNEVINFSFSDPEREAVLASGLQPVEIRNPVSTRASLLRTTLVGSLLETAAWNRNRGLESIHIFEVGNTYYREEPNCCERLCLGLLSTGPLAAEAHWRGKSREADIYYVKGALEALFGHLRYEAISFEPADHCFYESGSSLAVSYKEAKIGHLGRVTAKIRDFMGVKQPVYACEIDLKLLFEKQPKAFTYTPVPKFPAVIRDFSLLVPKEVAFQDLKKAIEKLPLPNLEDFHLIDLYTGETVPQDKASLTLRLIYRHPQRTLLAEEVDKTEQQVLNQLKRVLGVQLREGGQIDNRTGKN